MADLRNILELWRHAQASGQECCLITLVRVEGSSYRKPGARMLLTRSGQRAGTISGGCLEAEVQKKAWWLTAHGPAIERYSSFFDDDAEIPYGLGCGGTVWLLMERGAIVDYVLTELSSAADSNRAVVLGVALSGAQKGTRVIFSPFLHPGPNPDTPVFAAGAVPPDLLALVRQASVDCKTQWSAPPPEAREPEFFAEYAPPPQKLFLFGAGDDAQPVVSLAHSLGWHVTVADGRAHLATEQRFPLATRIAVLPPEDSAAFSALGIQERDAVVLLTHSYEQDKACLQHLLQLPALPRYVGILGPHSRTQHLRNAVSIPSNAPDWARWLHSPVGLDIGSSSPSEIALSIVAEIQAVIMGKQSGGRATELEPQTAAAQP